MKEVKKQISVKTCQFMGYGAIPYQKQGDVYFGICAQPDDEVRLVLYKKGSQSVCEEYEIPASAAVGSVRCVCVSGIKVQDTEYNFRINGIITVDPAARVVTGRPAFADQSVRAEHQIRGGFLSPDRELVNDQRPCHTYADVVSYYLHVRGFTMSRNSRVKHKGTFTGIIEKIPYFLHLGINQLILMPCCEFEEVSQAENNVPAYARKDVLGRRENEPLLQETKINYWGYTKSWYFAPKSSYCASQKPDVEFRKMVSSLHTAGIEVIMEFAFPTGTDVSFVLQCLSDWARDYHVDGFRLLADEKITDAAARSHLLSQVKLISHYYDENAYPKSERSHLADMNDAFRYHSRRLLKSDENAVSDFILCMKQQCEKGVLHYITEHDGFTLMDLVSYDHKHNDANGEQGRDGGMAECSWNCGEEGPTKKKAILQLRRRQIKNALMMLFFAQSTPVLLSGDEHGNTQFGNNNPYCIDDETTWLDWNHRFADRELTEFTAQLIRIRKEYMPRVGKEGVVQLSTGYPLVSVHGEKAWYQDSPSSSASVGIMYCGMKNGDEQYMYCAYNCHWDEKVLALPILPGKMEWKMICSSAGENLPVAGRELLMPGRTSYILIGRETENDNEVKA